jgi:hypothetical protein
MSVQGTTSRFQDRRPKPDLPSQASMSLDSVQTRDMRLEPKYNLPPSYSSDSSKKEEGKKTTWWRSLLDKGGNKRGAPSSAPVKRVSVEAGISNVCLISRSSLELEFQQNTRRS